MSERMARLFEQQAASCEELGSPLYGALMRRAAQDIRAGGVVAQALAGHEQDPAPSALALRLFGAVHRLVLECRAEELEPYYPSVGGEADPDGAWPAFQRVLRRHTAELRRLVEQPPQTNEVGRSAPLTGGLLHLAARWNLPVRLFEIGASAGLNLLADEYRYEYAGGALGPIGSPVVLRNAWVGALPEAFLKVVERAGADTDPIDPTTPEGQLRLAAYVWPDQAERLARLRGALQVACRVPVRLVRATAADFVRGLELVPGQATVLWHSVMWQYLSAAEQRRIEAEIDRLGARATERAPFAHLCFEPRRRIPGQAHEFLVVLRTWPGGEARILGAAPPHGVPVRWE